MADPKGIAQSYFDAWNRHDAAGIVALFTAGGTYTDPLAPGLTGAAIGNYAAGLWESFPDLAFEVGDTTLSGPGMVAAQWLMKGTNTRPFRGLPPSDRAVVLPGADFIRIDGERIRSVTGYFDGGEVPRQLGMQVVVQPSAIGPFRWGTSVAVPGEKRTRPGAFSITSLNVRTDEEANQVREASRQIALETMKMPGFLGFMAMSVGDRFMTVTAWEDPENARRVMRESTHVQAVKGFMGPRLAAGGFTSVWTLGRFNATWIRCLHCGRMADYDNGEDRKCGCGQGLPEPPPYW
jgi:steroid delta-isomerase-like uncharacterized protein